MIKNWFDRFLDMLFRPQYVDDTGTPAVALAMAELISISRVLSRKLHNMGIERTPDDVADALLLMSDGLVFYATDYGRAIVENRMSTKQLLEALSELLQGA